MQMQLNHPPVAIFHNEGVEDTVASPNFTSDHTYTLNVYRFFYNDQCPSTQCTWTMNIGSPQPGSHSITFVSPLNGANVVSGVRARLCGNSFRTNRRRRLSGVAETLVRHESAIADAGAICRA